MPTTGKRKRDENTDKSESASAIWSKRPRTQNEDVNVALRTLLEFWFSDANLGKDKYLTSVMLDNDGWVPVSLFLNFNRVKALSVRKEDVISALGAIQKPSLEFRYADDGETSVRLSGGLSTLEKTIERAKHDEGLRTIYIETLPHDIRREQLQSALEKFGEIVYVSIPRYKSGKCKGFAFVEFAEVTSAEEALRHTAELQLDVESPPALRAITLQEWQKRKGAYKELLKEHRKTVAKKASATTATKRKSPQPGSSIHNPSLLTPTTELPQAVSPIADMEVDEIQSVPVTNEGNEEKETITTPPFEKGLIVSISGLNAAEKSVKRRSLYQDLKEFGQVAYIDYSPKRSDVCFVRYENADSAQKAVQALSPTGGSLVLGAAVIARLLTGESESKYWAVIHSQRLARKAQGKERNNKSKADRKVPPRINPKRAGKKKSNVTEEDDHDSS